MAFTQAIWKSRLHEQLVDWRLRMTQCGAESVYGYLAALTLWPVIEEARGGDWGAVGAFFAMTGGGGSLLATHLQRWQPQAPQSDQAIAELAGWLTSQATVASEVRLTLDQILATFEVFPLARQSLPESEGAWFARALRAELSQLGNLAHYTTKLTTSRALIHDQSTLPLREGQPADGALLTARHGTGPLLGASHLALGEGGSEGLALPPGTIVLTDQGARVVSAAHTAPLKAVDAHSELGRYLTLLIENYRLLRLPGVRLGGRLVHIELEQIFVTLRATQQRPLAARPERPSNEVARAPGEMSIVQLEQAQRRGSTTSNEPISITGALADHRRLVVLGEPGSGKTTLLRYLALIYARDLADGGGWVQERLGLSEKGMLPIMLSLRQVATFLSGRGGNDDGTVSDAVVQEFCQHILPRAYLLPANFFDGYLQRGQAILLLDGLNEVSDAMLQRRVVALIEALTRRYPGCRYVVACRTLAYRGGVRLDEGFAPSTMSDMTLAEIERFLYTWQRLIAIGQRGPGADAEHQAHVQTQNLLEAIWTNGRVRDLAVTPLMLIMMALVQRYRARLPDRRAELYAEAVDVLLGRWDRPRGEAEMMLAGVPFDAGDKRLMLQGIALHMHERGLKEIEIDELHLLLGAMFARIGAPSDQVEQSVNRFLEILHQRSGLLVARTETSYGFAHLSLQEYLTALAVATQDEYVALTLEHVADGWWREVILLEAGYLSTQSTERTSRLLWAIADHPTEPEPFHNLILATECLYDVGSTRVLGGLGGAIRQRLRAGLEGRSPTGRLGRVQQFFARVITPETVAEQRRAGVRALARIGGPQAWSFHDGEPEWIDIPAGPFTMGSGRGYSNERPARQLVVPRFWIAPTLVTNAQYERFLQATGHQPPEHWEGGHPPRRRENHPVVNVRWHDVRAYCHWLSQATGKHITLPSEAEWEKAARGSEDTREYPWGDVFDQVRCNSEELGLDETTPVGIFPGGASPYGVLDMSGNVWEWTRSLWGETWERPTFGAPYEARDGREDLNAPPTIARVVRGGGFNASQKDVRCATRSRFLPTACDTSLGFRVVVLPPT